MARATNSHIAERSRLVPALLDAGWQVVVLARNADRIRERMWADSVDVIEGGTVGAVQLGAVMAIDTRPALAEKRGARVVAPQREYSRCRNESVRSRENGWCPRRADGDELRSVVRVTRGWLL